MTWLPVMLRHEGGLNRFGREFEDLFDNFFSNRELRPYNGRTSGWIPAINLEETDKELIVTADLPGIEAKDVDITLENNVLTLKGERKSEIKEENKDLHRIERVYGSFHRSLMLPEKVDVDKVTATSKNGVISVKLPKTKAAISKRIEVEAK